MSAPWTLFDRCARAAPVLDSVFGEEGVLAKVEAKAIKDVIPSSASINTLTQAQQKDDWRS